jgi:hypothetical protein
LLGWSRKWSVRIALAAIAILVLQTAMAAAAAARTTNAVDAFGNPLCIAGYPASGADQPANGHHDRLLNCCAFGCSASSIGLEASGQPQITAPGLLLALVRLPSRQGFLVAAADHSPGSPRAPPSAA